MPASGSMETVVHGFGKIYARGTLMRFSPVGRAIVAWYSIVVSTSAWAPAKTATHRNKEGSKIFILIE